MCASNFHLIPPGIEPLQPSLKTATIFLITHRTVPDEKKYGFSKYLTATNKPAKTS